MRLARLHCGMAVGLLGSALTASPSAAADSDASLARGQALFTGAAPLTGRIEGHTTTLPPSAISCISCHGAVTRKPGGWGPPALGQGWLRQTISRRDGPPGSYDAGSFCQAIRTGVDPVKQHLPTRMPRFELPDDDCHALWTYLNAPP